MKNLKLWWKIFKIRMEQLHGFNHPYYHEWDEHLQHVMNLGEVVKTCSHTVTFRYQDVDYVIWKANKWYSYAILYECSDLNEMRRWECKRPSIRRMIEFEKFE